jgi:hypothetical protein
MLPAETERVWTFLAKQPALAGFVLIGGSALALRLRHRISEDLDLAFPGPRLPRARLDALLRLAHEAGFDFQRNDDEAALQQFAGGGLELHDYQQDFLVNQVVKVSFFTLDAPQIKVLSELSGAVPRVASLVELFKTKCLVSATRSKTRDWLDLYMLLRQHGFSLRDYAATFCEGGIESQCDLGLSRLCSGMPQRDDEGYAHLLADAPTVKEMQDFFVEERKRWEIETATETARRRRPGGGG